MALSKPLTAIMDDLIIEYGRSAGRVVISLDKSIHFSASLKDGCYVSAPPKTFNRLVNEGRMDLEGYVLEDENRFSWYRITE